MKYVGSSADLLLLALAALPAGDFLPYADAGKTVGLTEVATTEAMFFLIENRYVDGAGQRLGRAGVMMDARRLSAHGRMTAEKLALKRDSRSARRAGARTAVLQWLYDLDGPAPDWAACSEQFGTDYLGTAFTVHEVEEAASFLASRGLIAGFSIEESSAPVLATVTVEGQDCAEQYDYDVNAYIKAQSGVLAVTTGPTFNVTGRNVQVSAGDGAHNEMQLGEIPRRLALAVDGLVDLLTTQEWMTTEDRSVVAVLADGAKEDVTAATPSVTGVRRFVDWLLGRANEAASQATMSALTVLSSGLLADAEHIVHALGA